MESTKDRYVLHILGMVFKYLAGAVLVIVALGALWIALIMRLGGPIVMILMGLLSLWCIAWIWFLHIRRKVSATARRRMVTTLSLFPVFYCLAWTNLWRLEQHLAHRDWLTFKSEHFVFHYAPDYVRSRKIADFAVVHDQVFDENCAYLDVSIEDRINFYVYGELDEGLAVPDWNVILADDDQSIGHEMTHIIAYHIADRRQKITLLDEGIATWLNRSTRATDHHGVAWKYIQANGLPLWNELSQSRSFRRHMPQPYYPAASFVGYLIKKYGIDAFRWLWTANARYPGLYEILEDLKLARYFSFIPGERAHFESTVLKIYGRALNELDTEWRAWLAKKVTRKQRNKSERLLT